MSDSTDPNQKDSAVQIVHQLTGFQRDPLYTIAGLDRPSGREIKETQEVGKEISDSTQIWIRSSIRT